MARRPERVVITGVAIHCALGEHTDEVWKAIVRGERGIRPTRRLDVSALSCHHSGELGEVRVPAHRPKGRLDRAVRLALGAAGEAIGYAGLHPAAFDPYRAGVALGTSAAGLAEGERFHWQLLRDGPEAARRHHLLVFPRHTSADAISVAFGLKGPKAVFSDAGAAGANSIGYAADVIRAGRADVMLAGGVDVLDILSFAGFHSLRALDSRPCAPYARSSGLNLGEGAAFLVLEAESVAAGRGVPVLGWVRGYALTGDAHHATAPDPAGDGLRRAMAGALARSGLEPGEVDYVNGHGTGAPADDGAETTAVDALFGAARPPMSSTKSQVGHLLGAAGAVEAAICVLALRDQVLPPADVPPGVDVAAMDLPPAAEAVKVAPGMPSPGDSVPPVVEEVPSAADVPPPVNVAAMDVPPAAEAVKVVPSPGDSVPPAHRGAGPKVIVSNSFAFGGSNCALVLGGDAGPVPRPASRRVVVTGAGVVSPLGIGRREFVDAVRSGAVGAGAVDAARFRHHLDPGYARRLDQLGLLVLAATRLAVRDSGFAVTRANSERTGLVFGTGTGPLETVAKLTETIGREGPHKVPPRLFPNAVANAAAGHACLALQLKGPLSTLATGGAAGVSGLGYAADLIREGEADVMLAVSADELTPMLRFGYDRLGLLATGAARPYERESTGCALGAAGAALVLESLDHARSRGADILAEVAGHAVTSDAHRVAGNEPSGRAWSESFRRAVADGGLGPADIATVYGDARGTAVLDLAEARALARVWRPGEVALANLGAQAGHLHSTTAVLSAICAVETLRTGWVPPLSGLRDPLSEVEGYLGRREDAGARAVLVTAANWGGTYASAVFRPWTAA